MGNRMRPLFSGVIPIIEDNHIHTTFSDGHDKPEDMIRATLAVGIRGICFTDHAREESDYVPIYLEEIRRLKKSTKIEILKLVMGWKLSLSIKRKY